MPQQGAGDLRDGQAVEGAGEFAPDREVAAFLEQRGGQQQIDGDPGRQLAQPLLGRAVLGQDGIDHVERHDLSQFTEVAGGEDPTGDSDLAGDGRLNGQRSSICNGCLWSVKPFLPELRFLHQSGIPQVRPDIDGQPVRLTSWP